MVLNTLIGKLAYTSRQGIYVSEEVLVLQFLFPEDVSNIAEKPVLLKRTTNTVYYANQDSSTEFPH